MSLLNLFFPFFSFLPHHSIHFSFTHQQIQLNPDSNSLYVHINYSALHAVQMPPHPPHPLSCATVALATRGGSADVRDSSKDTHAGTGSGDMYCCRASTNTQEQNGCHPPHIFFFFLPHGRVTLWDLNKRGSATCACLIPFWFDDMCDMDDVGYSRCDWCDRNASQSWAVWAPQRSAACLKNLEICLPI